MDPNLTTAIVSACATSLVAIVALVLNSKRFEDMNKRFEDINKRFEDINKRFDDMNKRMDDMGKRIDRVEKILDTIQSDIREFFRILGDHDKRIQRLEDKQQ